MSAHQCPPYCHRCPHLKGDDGKNDVMPWCMGTAAFGTTDMCTCGPRRPKTPKDMRRDIDRLQRRRVALLKEVADVERLINESTVLYRRTVLQEAPPAATSGANHPTAR